MPLPLHELPPLELDMSHPSGRISTVTTSVLHGQFVRMVAIGEIEKFQSGEQGAMCRICEPEVAERLGGRLARPGLIPCYVGFFRDRHLAQGVAMELAAHPILFVEEYDDCILTTRGFADASATNFADGGRNPRLPTVAYRSLRNALIAGLKLNLRQPSNEETP